MSLKKEDKTIFGGLVPPLKISNSKGSKRGKVVPKLPLNIKLGRIHGNPVADSLVGVVMRKPLGTQKCYGRMEQPTNQPTRQSIESRVRDKKR